MYEVSQLNKQGGYQIRNNQKDELFGCYKNADVASEHHVHALERIEKLKRMLERALKEQDRAKKDELILTILRC